MSLPGLNAVDDQRQPEVGLVCPRCGLRAEAVLGTHIVCERDGIALIRWYPEDFAALDALIARGGSSSVASLP